MLDKSAHFTNRLSERWYGMPSALETTVQFICDVKLVARTSKIKNEEEEEYSRSGDPSVNLKPNSEPNTIFNVTLYWTFKRLRKHYEKWQVYLAGEVELVCFVVTGYKYVWPVQSRADSYFPHYTRYSLELSELSQGHNTDSSYRWWVTFNSVTNGWVG